MAANITYSSIVVNKYNPITGKAVPQNIALASDSAKASFQDPCNSIAIKFTNDISLSKYLVRVTAYNDDYDVDLGTLVLQKTNIAGNSTTSITIKVNATNFNKGDGKYRIGLYAQSSFDYTWDVTYLFFTIDNATFIPADASGLEVWSNKAVNN